MIWDLISIDPGVHWLWCTGWLGGEARELYAIPASPKLVLPAAEHLAIEKPRFYGPAKSKDLIDLAIRVGWAQVSFGGDYTEYTPNQWKGSMPKAQHSRTRIKPAMTPRELALVKDFCKSLPKPKPKEPEANILDSVGIGLKHLGRL